MHRGCERITRAEKLGDVTREVTQHTIHSLGRLTRAAHQRTSRSILILGIREERLGGRAAVVVSRSRYQRGGHDGRERIARVEGRAPL